MTTHLETLAQYLPALLVERSNASHLPIDEPATERFPAAIMRVQVSGFAQLAEGLASEAATQKLGALLNGYFGKLLDIIFDHHGDVVRFDATSVLAMWRTDREERRDVPTSILRAGRCALNLQRVITPQEPVPGVRVALRIGLGVGQVQMMTVGGADNRWEPVLMGAPLAQTEACLEDVGEGQVFLTREAWSLIRFRSVGERGGAHTARLDGIKGTLPDLNEVYPEPNDRSQAPMWSYTPAPIRKHVANREPSPPLDRRQVTVIHVHISGIQADDELDAAQEAVKGVQAALYAEEGEIVQTAFERNGVILVAALGLPPLPHDDDATRGLRVALAMRRELERLDLAHSIGVASGQAICASIGHAKRRTFTVVGEVYNTAAALTRMGAGVLCDTPTRMSAEQEFTFESLPPIRVNGRETQVHRPVALMSATGAGRSVLVGREREVQMLERGLSELLASPGTRAIALEGDPGIGKTRLLQELERLALARSLSPLLGQGDPVDRARPYHAWSGILTRALGLTDLDLIDLEEAQLLELLKETPRAVQLAPLLASMLPIDISDNVHTADLTGANRSRAMSELVIAIMGAYTNGRPTLLILDDAHWFDTESWSLVEAVWRSTSPLLLVVATRTGLDAAPYKAILDSSRCAKHELGALSREHMLQLAKQRYGSLPDQLQEFVRAHAAGNPLHCEQLIEYVIQRGVFKPGSGLAIRTADLQALETPADLEGLVAARVQALPPGPRRLLGVASVVGRTFDFMTLHDVLGEVDMATLAAELSELERLAMTPVIRREPEELYVFGHAVIQDAAYQGLSPRERSELHQAVATWYEQEFEASLGEGSHPRLAYHWREAGQMGKAAAYITQAANLGMRSGAWADVVRVLDDALQANLSTVPKHVVARWQRQIGEAWLRQGELERSQKHLAAALDALGLGAPDGGFAAKRQMWWQSIVQTTHKVYVRKTANDEERQSTLEAARADLLLGEAAMRTGDIIRARLYTTRAINAAERLGDGPELPIALGQSAAVLQAQGNHVEAEAHASKALHLAMKHPEQDQLPQLYRTLAAVFAASGTWAKEVDAIERAVALADRIGDRQLATEASTIHANALHLRGEYALAMTEWTEATNTARAIGHRSQLLWALCGSAEVALRRGNLPEGVLFLQKAASSFTAGSSSAARGRVFALNGAFMSRRGDHAGAVEQARQALMLFQKAPPINHDFLEAYGAIVETAFLAAESDPNLADEVYDRNVELGEAGLKLLDAFASVVPIAAPRAKMLRGWLLWMDNASEKGTQAMLQAIEAAQDLRMPLEEGLARLELGRRRGFLDKLGRENLTSAEQIFSDLDARYDLHRATRIVQEV